MLKAIVVESQNAEVIVILVHVEVHFASSCCTVIVESSHNIETAPFRF